VIALNAYASLLLVGRHVIASLGAAEQVGVPQLAFDLSNQIQIPHPHRFPGGFALAHLPPHKEEAFGFLGRQA